jgi:hypothetical protein
MQPKDDLLKEIKRISEMKNHGETNLNLIAPIYAELLCVLSEETEVQSLRNIELSKDTRDLTKKLHTFTIILIVLAAIQIGVAFLQFFYPIIHTTKQSTSGFTQTNSVVK